MESTVIIIGGDHHNTLAAIRALGRKKCIFEIIVHDNCLTNEKVKVFKSKYAKNAKHIVIKENENELIEYLISRKVENSKDILYLTSDYSAMVVDKYYSKLEKKYFLPGFSLKPGKISELMNKYNQYLFARKCNIPMAESLEISVDDDEIQEKVIYPCIVKPVVSALGSKNDIKRCDNKTELERVFEEYRYKGYKKLLVQEFLNKKCEVCTLGALFNSKNGEENICGGVLIKERETFNGSTSYAVCAADVNDLEQNVKHTYNNLGNKLSNVTEQELIDVVRINKKLLECLYDNGYKGSYDIEYFICDDGIYLNEINFRQSGNAYMMEKQGVNVAYYWVYSMLNNSLPEGACLYFKKGKYNMDELGDIIHVKKNKKFLLSWIKQYLNASAHAIFDIFDLRGTIAFYLSFIKSVYKSK